MDNTLKIIEALNAILSTIAWPAVTLVILFVLKTPISNLIMRITKIGYDKAGIVAESPRIQSDNPDESSMNKLSHENLDKALGLFSNETLQFFEDAVLKETNLKDFKTSEERESVLYKYSQAIYLIMHFNKIYQMIFGSQIRLLQALNGSEIEDFDSLKVFYTSAKTNNPKGYEGYSYEQYLGFLIRFGLILVDKKDNIKITILGRDFLKYMIETGLSTEKYN